MELTTYLFANSATIRIEKIFKIEIILIVNTLKNSNFDYLSKDNYDFINRELDSSTIFLQKEV
jgi:hypothetical protein